MEWMDGSRLTGRLLKGKIELVKKAGVTHVGKLYRRIIVRIKTTLAASIITDNHFYYSITQYFMLIDWI